GRSSYEGSEGGGESEDSWRDGGSTSSRRGSGGSSSTESEASEDSEEEEETPGWGPEEEEEEGEGDEGGSDSEEGGRRVRGGARWKKSKRCRHAAAAAAAPIAGRDTWEEEEVEGRKTRLRLRCKLATAATATTGPSSSSSAAPLMVPISEAELNGRGTDPRVARLLVVCSKYETGYDDPRLGAMFIDRPLSGSRAVQVLGRLNRPAPHLGKRAALVGVTDFVNSAGVLREAFEEFYDVTCLHTGRQARRLQQERQLVRTLGRILEALQPAADTRRGEGGNKDSSCSSFMGQGAQQAMLAFVGFCSQAAVTGKGPIDCLTTHLADPGHNNIYTSSVGPETCVTVAVLCVLPMIIEATKTLNPGKESVPYFPWNEPWSKV
ncbi:hypothetical protein Agub_g6163, partial [Astrephomene gubernaculifera]